MTKIIHLSDLHFGAHDDMLVAGVEERVDLEQPDLVVVSGDFTQRARTEQFKEACAFLTRLKDKGHEVLGVPGNHDVPLYDVLRRFLSPLARYRRYIDDTLCPFIELSGVAVLGINTARSLTFKDGHINQEQIEHIRKCFASVAPEKPRVLVMHHPLFRLPVGEGPALAKAMNDSERALNVIAELGVDLLLAGHNHRASAHDAEELVRGAGKALVIQAGTATSVRVRDQEQSFNRISFGEEGEVTVTIQRWSGDAFVDGDTQCFERRRGRDGARWRTEDGAKVEEAAETTE